MLAAGLARGGTIQFIRRPAQSGLEVSDRIALDWSTDDPDRRRGGCNGAHQAVADGVLATSMTRVERHR